MFRPWLLEPQGRRRTASVQRDGLPPAGWELADHQLSRPSSLMCTLQEEGRRTMRRFPWLLMTIALLSVLEEATASLRQLQALLS